MRTLEAQREALRILLLNHSLEAIGEAQFAAIAHYLDIYEAVDGRKRLAEWEFLSELEGVLRPQPRPEQPPASFTVRRAKATLFISNSHCIVRVDGRTLQSLRHGVGRWTR